MYQWFAQDSTHPFELFSFSHFTMLIIFGLGTLLLIVYRDEVTYGKKAHNIVRWSLLTALVTSELSYQLWAFAHNLYFTYEYLPLHLCGIASLTGISALLTYHRKLIQANYFIAVIPAIIALVVPEIPHGYEHFRFWKFFIHHMAIPWTGLFLILTTRISITLKIMCETYCYLVLYAVAVGIFNKTFHTNYLFLTRPPASFPALSALDTGLGYHINLALLTFGVFSLLLVFYKWGYSRKRSENDGI
ncbi:TIGR02206 family membrane protein [Halobacillus sp. Marseille-P3879]|uniref:YwaF family protein n=1 Tax=Halobacillus TaxID=45667 RepID=UPI000C7D059E|nr:TIGR02206 family membrane protein [Halobacillus sp. Marseille-P3879]